MTARELIAELQKLPAETEVWIVSCMSEDWATVPVISVEMKPANTKLRPPLPTRVSLRGPE